MLNKRAIRLFIILIEERVLLFGAGGFIGSALSIELAKSTTYLGLTRKDLNVCEYSKVKQIILEFKPTVVINATGKVAGIQGNIDDPVSLMRSNSENILSLTNVCHELKINKVIQFASACVYPLNEIDSSKPMDLGTGIIEKSSKPYATSKIFGIELFNSYRKQFGYKWSTVIPTNLYGTGDWKTDNNGHVIAMLTKKFLEAKKRNLSQVNVWGDGKAIRNFLNIVDLAALINFFIKNDMIDREIINVSGDKEVSIEELATIIKKVSEYQGVIKFDKSKPNGAHRKNLDDEPLRSLGWAPKVSLEEGIRKYFNELLTLTL